MRRNFFPPPAQPYHVLLSHSFLWSEYRHVPRMRQMLPCATRAARTPETSVLSFLSCSHHVHTTSSAGFLAFSVLSILLSLSLFLLLCIFFYSTVRSSCCACATKYLFLLLFLPLQEFSISLLQLLTTILRRFLSCSLFAILYSYYFFLPNSNSTSLPLLYDGQLVQSVCHDETLIFYLLSNHYPSLL